MVDVPMKWQNLKNNMYASNLLFSWGKNDKKSSKIFKVTFRQQIMGRTHVFEWLPKLNRSATSVADVKNSGHS